MTATRRYHLAQRRKAMGFSQEQLAERLEVDRSTVVRWESGGNEPLPWARPRLAKALQISLDQLTEMLGIETYPTSLVAIRPAPTTNNVSHDDLVADREGSSEFDDMNRRELLRLMTMAGTLVAMSGIEDGVDWERLAYFAAGQHQLDAAAVAEYGTLNGHLWRVFALSKTKRHTYPLVREQLAVLVSALQRSQGAAVHRDLCALTADLFQLAGEILFDGNHYTEAAHCYTLAATASKEGDAFDLWACALTRHAFIGVYEEQFVKAGPLLELAAGLARRGDQALSTRYWVRTVQAQTFAGLGDLDACQQALDDADDVHQLSGKIHTDGWLRFDGSRLPEERGTCYVALRRPDLAEQALNNALSVDLSARRRGSVLTDLATLGLQRRDVDQLVNHAGAAANIARQTGSGVVCRKLQSLQGQLTPLLTDCRVRQLDQEITALTKVSG
ncbi:helix-turn-helix transcriptional regulator [Amycolatopsis sp. H20-H5]|uniref:helix-turn-helix transcriptional regulator n=1 Tax=Amycolatopsis sp. H20-H5 TaxID=3046309 RepID=UPI002DBF69BA|nr:helix-turn-helix transcriptional regulator [Amycolatopsis sp. H20-H5]MEC3979656.1 helix-turn-helix transcriptional regulator [Amycolatopsis sp. H20-H5]